MQEPDSLEINLGKYIEVLFRQWQLILAITIVIAGAAFISNSLKPKVYQARALIASTKVIPVINLGSTTDTVSTDRTDYRLVDQDARLQSYVQLVKNPAVAKAVIDKLGDKLPKSDQDVATLLSKVSGSLLGKSDSIQIEVTHKNPEMAAIIANAWANAYVEQVNNIYASVGLSDSYTAVKKQKEEAKQTYDQAEQDLLDFTANNQVDELKRQINEHQALIDNLSLARSYATGAIITDTMTAQLSVFQGQVQNLEMQLTQVYEDSRRVERLLRNAQDMLDQVNNGGSAAAHSNALALTLLKAQAFAADNTDTSSNLQIQTIPVDMTPEEMIADLGGLIQSLQARQEDLNNQADLLSRQLLVYNGSSDALGVNTAGPGGALVDEGQATLQSFLELKGVQGALGISVVDTTPLELQIKDLEAKVNELKAQYSQAYDTQQELTRAKDLAWDTYSNLAVKETELKVAAQTSGTEVALAAPAISPKSSSTRLQDLSLAVLSGLIIGIFLAFFIEFWWRYKGIEPVPIAITSVLDRRRSADRSSPIEKPDGS